MTNSPIYPYRPQYIDEEFNDILFCPENGAAYIYDYLTHQEEAKPVNDIYGLELKKLSSENPIQSQEEYKKNANKLKSELLINLQNCIETLKIDYSMDQIQSLKEEGTEFNRIKDFIIPLLSPKLGIYPVETIAECIQNIFKDGLPEEEKKLLRKVLMYLYPTQTLISYYDPLINPRIINLSGLSLIVDSLTKKGLLRLPTKVCSADDFKKFMSERKNLEQLPCVFLIQDPTSVHFTPVYIDQVNTTPHIFATDGFLNDTYIDWIKEFARSNKMKFTRLNVVRQKDRYNCSIFCIQDAIEFGKNTSIISKIIDIHEDQYDLQPAYLPLSFWKTTQSLKSIQYVHSGKIIQDEQGKLDSLYIEKNKKLIEMKNFPQSKEIEEEIKKLNDDLVEIQNKFKILDEVTPQQQELDRFISKINKYTQDILIKSQPTTANTFADRRGDKFEGLIWSHIICSTS